MKTVMIKTNSDKFPVLQVITPKIQEALEKIEEEHYPEAWRRISNCATDVMNRVFKECPDKGLTECRAGNGDLFVDILFFSLTVPESLMCRDDVVARLYSKLSEQMDFEEYQEDFEFRALEALEYVGKLVEV